MAELGEQLGKPEIAHRGWSRLAELDRKDPTALRKSADALWALGKSGEAVEAWRRSLDLQPQDPEAHRSLGRAYIQTGEVQQALNHYGAAVRLSPHDPSLPLEAGASAMRHGFLAEAAGLLAEAVERDPGSAQGWAGLGECRVQLGEWGEAELALSRAVDLMADSPRVAALQALTALAMGDHGSAMTWLSQAAGTKPAGLPDALWTARALLRMAHWGEAARILKDLTTTPDERAAGLAMGEIRVALLEARWAWAQAGADLSQLEAALRESSSGTAKPTRITDDLRLREQVLLRPGDQAALDALQSYVQRAQGGAAAQTLGIGLINAGQFETALKAVETLQPVTYGFDWRPLVQACALRRLDRTEAALEALEIGAQDPVLRPLAEALTAGIQAASGRRELAIAAWNRSLGARPQEPAWQHALAALYLEGGQWDQALPHLQQAVDQAPGAVSYRMQLAKALAACGHAVEAVASFKLAIDRGEPSRQELLEAGEAALAAEAAEVALDWFDRAQALAPDDPRGLVGSARAAMALGKVRKARERIEAALKAAPHDPAVRLGQGEILLQQRDYSGALQALSQARGLGGEGRARLIQTRSRARMALDQGEQAERELLVELEADPQNPALWFPLAKVRESRGEWAAAAEAAAQAVRLAPLNPEYRLGLAQVCRQSGNLDRALDELSRAREMAPSDPRLPLEQGRVHEERREFRRALEAYRKAIELDGRCMQAYYRSGLVLKQLKSYPQAGQMLKRAAELAPIDREVLHQLAAVRALELVHGPATGAVH
jgi:superkiller protein 3